MAFVSGPSKAVKESEDRLIIAECLEIERTAEGQGRSHHDVDWCGNVFGDREMAQNKAEQHHENYQEIASGGLKSEKACNFGQGLDAQNISKGDSRHEVKMDNKTNSHRTKGKEQI